MISAPLGDAAFEKHPSTAANQWSETGFQFFSWVFRRISLRTQFTARPMSLPVSPWLSLSLPFHLTRSGTRGLPSSSDSPKGLSWLCRDTRNLLPSWFPPQSSIKKAQRTMVARETPGKSPAILCVAIIMAQETTSDKARWHFFFPSVFRQSILPDNSTLVTYFCKTYASSLPFGSCSLLGAGQRGTNSTKFQNKRTKASPPTCEWRTWEGIRKIKEHF